MKHYLTLLALFIIVLLYSNNYHAQLISKFDWDSNPVTNSQQGPNAISVSSSVTSSPNGVGGTNGLNAGLPKLDIDFVLPAAAFMNIGGIDFSIDFQRDESRGDFITSGTNFSFGIDGGDLFVKFEIDDNAGGTQLIEVYNIYAVPDDDIFRTYRFYYLPSTGTAEILVDGVVQWDYYIGNPSNLIWSNNNVVIGQLMDGNGLDKTIFDNMVIGEVYDSALPVELSSFEVNPLENQVMVKWVTESELNNDYFTIERSRDGQEFQEIDIIKGAGTSNEQHEYIYFDENPLNGVSYYRLRQTDFNGKTTLSEILSAKFESGQNIQVYPNLLEKQTEFNVRLSHLGELVHITLFSAQGKQVLVEEFVHKDQVTLKTPSSSGTYIVQVVIDGVLCESKKIIVK